MIVAQQQTACAGRCPFDVERVGTGTGEWAEFNENIARGCQNDCLYCYSAYNASARFHWRPRAEWAREELTKRANLTSYPKRDGVVMFPTAHDITDATVDAYIRVAKLIVEAGNHLLIVSKPKLDCMKEVLSALDDYKAQIMCRFTIGTTDRVVAKFWEPGAPSPEERIEALSLARSLDFRTSVSAEPLLGDAETAESVLAAVRPFVTHVWIGKMNMPQLRCGIDDPAVASAVMAIEQLQSDEAVLAMHARFKDDPLVRWKDSVKKVVTKGEKGASC